jgi:hypothetical protein
MTTLPPICNYFIDAQNRVVAAGYHWEIIWCKDMGTFEDCTPERFFEQYVWCVLNAGMKEQVARKIWERYLEKLDPFVIGHLGKRKAIETGLKEYVRWFWELKYAAEDPIEYLQTLPWIGPITKYHLARNIGFDCVKPDRHLVKLANHFGFDSPLSMCKMIQHYFTTERLGTIDVILWRDCNLRGGR